MSNNFTEPFNTKLVDLKQEWLDLPNSDYMKDISKAVVADLYTIICNEVGFSKLRILHDDFSMDSYIEDIYDLDSDDGGMEFEQFFEFAKGAYLLNPRLDSNHIHKTDSAIKRIAELGLVSKALELKKDLLQYETSATEDLVLSPKAKKMKNSIDTKLSYHNTFMRLHKNNPLFNIHFPANEPFFERGPGLTYLTAKDEIGHLDIFKKVFYDR